MFSTRILETFLDPIQRGFPLKKLFAILFLPIRLIFLGLRGIFLAINRGNHIYLKIPAKFNDSHKSFLLKRFQGEEDLPFFTEFLIELNRIKKDPRVKFLSIEVPTLHYGFSEVASIHTELSKIREQGVDVRGYADEGDLKTLFLLSACNRRYTSVTAEFLSILPSVESSFFGELAKKWKVRVDIFQSGPYKSFGEIFTRTEFSKEAKSNLSTLIQDLRSEMLGVFANENILTETILQKPIHTGGSLKELGFFHGLLGKDSYEDNFLQKDPSLYAKLAEENEDLNNEKAKKTFLKQNKPASKALTTHSVLSRQKFRNFKVLGNSNTTITILPLKGEIRSGKPEDKEPKSGVIEGEAIRQLIRQIKETPYIKAVLLEIDSPGGSATESEKIFQALKDLNKTKPVYAYMSNTCASGGYYLACAARKIYSSPIGIVGSIGTIVMRFDLEGLYKKFGISKDRIGFYPQREIFSDSGKLSKESQSFLKKEIDRVESLFIKRVQDSRNLGKEILAKMTGGRVFAPIQFQAAGLSDKICSLIEAIEDIKELENLKNINIVYQAPRYNMKLAIRENLPIGLPFSSTVAGHAFRNLKNSGKFSILFNLAESSHGEIQHLNLAALFLKIK